MEETRGYILGETDRDPLTYRVGETMRFDFCVHAADTAAMRFFRWTIDGDDGRHEEGCIPARTGDGLTLRTACNRPGFVHVVVEACDGGRKPLPLVDRFEGGAGADIDRIRCSTAKPADYDAYFEELSRLLDGVAPVPTEYTRLERSDVPEGYELYRVSLPMPFGNPSTGLLCMPQGAAPGSLDGKLVYFGYGGSPLPVNCEPGTAVLSVSAHGIAPDADASYYQELFRDPDGPMFYYGFDNLENSDPYTTYFRGMIARDLQAARFLRSLPVWNGRTLVATGGSQGAFQATAVAAHDRHVTRLSINIPWFCNLGGYKEERLRGWSPDYAAGLCYFDTAISATRVTCETDIHARLGDYICPPSSIMALYSNLRGKRSLTFHQNGTHGYVCPEDLTYTVG